MIRQNYWPNLNSSVIKKLPVICGSMGHTKISCSSGLSYCSNRVTNLESAGTTPSTPAGPLSVWCSGPGPCPSPRSSSTTDSTPSKVRLQLMFCERSLYSPDERITANFYRKWNNWSLSLPRDASRPVCVHHQLCRRSAREPSAPAHNPLLPDPPEPHPLPGPVLLLRQSVSLVTWPSSGILV